MLPSLLDNICTFALTVLARLYTLNRGNSALLIPRAVLRALKIGTLQFYLAIWTAALSLGLGLVSCSCEDSPGDESGDAGTAGSDATGGFGGTGGTVDSGGTSATGGIVGPGGVGATGGIGATGGVGLTGGVGATGGVGPTGGTGGTPEPSGSLKPRVVVLTDISTWDPNDHESMTRFLVHADLFEIEALIASTGYSCEDADEAVQIGLIDGVITAYETDLPKLLGRSNQFGHDFDNARQMIGYWPSPTYLRERTMMGSLHRGADFIGPDNDSPGSDMIIQLADEDDDRPIWVTVWGGGNTVAQSIYRVEQDRDAEGFSAFLRKIRVYTITDQDRDYTGAQTLSYSSHGEMRKRAGGDLLFIWDECAWGAHNRTGRNNWSQYETHIQDHGSLGSQYPSYEFGVEGDTPSFLYVMPTGLNDPDDPTQCSWGGTYREDVKNVWYKAGSCGTYFDRFYPAAFNNFAARMDWAQVGAGNRNPVIVLDGDNGVSVLTRTPQQGTQVTLDASKTTDPDGDNLKFSWWVQTDAGSYSAEVDISGSDSGVATVNVPSRSAGRSFHVICEVMDDGTHNLSDYRRIVFKPTE